MRHPPHRLAVLLSLLSACGGDARDERSAEPAQAKQATYAECMDAADRAPSRAETVAKAAECMRLPDAPAPGSTLPPGVPPPPGTAVAADSDEIRSVYTELDPARCRVIRQDKETGGSTSRCPGVAAYALNVHDDDARMSIDIITPDGREHPLNYWGVISSGFSSLGPRAEWRMRGGRPIALIVRVNASEDPVDSSRTTSYLAVAKITSGGVCVTDRIAPAADANEAARRAADASGSRPCAPDV